MTVTNLRQWTVALVLAAVPIVSACDILDGGGDPESARMVLDSEVAEQVVLVISTDFDLLGPGPEGGPSTIAFVEADTAEYTSPDIIVRDIRARLRVYVKMMAPEGLQTPVALNIFIDDGAVSTKLVSAPGDSAVFLYTFNSF